MTKRRILYITLLLSALCLFITTYLQFKLFIDYSNSTGKSRGLFGLKEMFQYSYRKYFTILPLFAVAISLFYTKYEELRFLSLTITLVSIMAIIFSLFSVWKLYI